MWWAYKGVDQNGQFNTMFSTGAGLEIDWDDVNNFTLAFLSGQSNGTVSLSLNSWTHFAITHANGSSSYKIYVNGVLDWTHTGTDQSWTSVQFGAWTGAQPLDARLDRIKFFEAELSADEIKGEMWHVMPRRAANVGGWWPIFPGSALRDDDFSSNGRNFTQNGTITDEESAPAVWWIPSAQSGGGGAAGAPLSLEHEGFRWRADDGSESAATWLASQDANITRAVGLNTRLRVLVNATNDPAPRAFELQYKDSRDAAYRIIEVE
jgi:hypothetical protein